MIPKMGMPLALSALVASAQVGNPPSRAACLNYKNDPVSFRPGSVDEWTAAVPNYPLTSGDHLWEDAGGAAQVHAGSSIIRMRQQTALSFLNLDDRTVQLSLTQGGIQVSIRDLRPDEVFEVDTPKGAVSLLRAGDYQIKTDGDTAVTAPTAAAQPARAPRAAQERRAQRGAVALCRNRAFQRAL